MSNSIARNNVTSNEENAIVISESHDNEIYNDTISNSKGGIDMDKESLNNAIHDNTVIVAKYDTVTIIVIRCHSGGKWSRKNNAIYSNTRMNGNDTVE